MPTESSMEHIRHSFAHLLAAAVLKLYPRATLGIGPVIEHGFYYDFGGIPLKDEHLASLEQEMRTIASQNLPFKKELWTKQKASLYFKKKNQPFKLELIKDLTAQKVGMVHTGDAFLDLCRGGHVKNTSEIPLDAFRLTKVAGAYWKGDEKRPQLTRIYGLAFSTKKELDTHLAFLEEAKKRDHRKIGEEQKLFLISQYVGSGFPIFTPKGFLLRNQIEQYITQEKQKRGYSFVWTPHIANVELYKQSGHWQKYDAMFSPMKIDEAEYILKPMNCPHHFQIYLHTPKSYRDLPLRIAENGTVYRYEKSGELNGLLRVRALTQDDSHLFVRHDQIAEEIDRVLDLMEIVYNTFGFKKYEARISVRDPKNKKKYLGSEKIWKEAEQALIQAAEKRRMKYFIGEGEAAFYGPKIDVVVNDSIGRKWQLTTCQLDFNQPENFDMTYIDEQGKKARPAILHVAILGSLERFIGIYIEETMGIFPLWLAPEQAWILPISDDLVPYAKEIQKKLSHLRIRVKEENETLGKKIREGEMEKIPYLLIVGNKEKESETVSVRKRGQGDLGIMSISQFIEQSTKEIQDKSF